MSPELVTGYPVRLPRSRNRSTSLRRDCIAAIQAIAADPTADLPPWLVDTALNMPRAATLQPA